MSTQPNKPDEREGMPSGSGAKRWLTCPGSHIAERGLPDSQTDDAAEGEMLHAVMEYGESAHRAKLTDEQAKCIDFCRETRRKLSAELLGVEDVHAFVEERWWLRDTATLEPLASCRIDWAGYTSDAMLILDWKFGRREVDAADVNDQLRFAAAVAWQDHAQLASVFVGIVAPRAEGERVTVARFSSAQCQAAHAEMVAGALRAMQPSQPRCPSAGACHYCRARGTEACPESIAETTDLATVSTAEIATPERVAELLEKCELAERVIDAIRSRAKARLEAGEPIPGWRLKPGSKQKKIIDQVAAWSRVGQQLIGGAEFAKCCTVSIAKLAAAVKANSTIEKLTDKSAREKVESLLGDAVVETQNAPSLAREVTT
jgi:hypothetical protein